MSIVCKHVNLKHYIVFYSLEARPGKDLLLSLTEHTLVGGLDEDGLASLNKVRNQVREAIIPLFGDSRPTQVEMLAFPLQLVPDLIDPVDIKADLEPYVGINNWPLCFLLTNLGVTLDPNDRKYYVTAEVHPDHACKVTLECQFFKGHVLRPFPPVKLFRLSESGWSAANKVRDGITQLTDLGHRFMLPVQVRNLILVTPHQCFKLRLCGLDMETNCLQWHDVTTVPSGYKDRDYLARFRNWGPENRLQTESNLDLTPAQAASPLGSMCPWMNQSMFQAKWQDLSPSKVQLVYTPGTISRTDRILSLIDTPNTTRLLRDSIQANFRVAGDGVAENYLKQVLDLRPEETDAEVDLAVKLLGSLLEQRNIGHHDVRNVRWTEQGFDKLGRMSKRYSYPESRQTQQQMGLGGALQSLLEEKALCPAPITSARATPTTVNVANVNDQRPERKRSPGQNEFLADFQSQLRVGLPPYDVSSKKPTREVVPRQGWAAQMQLPAPGADRKWRRLVEALYLPEPVTEAQLKGLLLSSEFQQLLQDLEPSEQAGVGINFLSLLESLRAEPELALAMYNSQDVAAQFPEQTFTEQQLKTIRDYSNVLRLAAASQVVPEQFLALEVPIAAPGGTPGAKPPLSSQSVLDNIKRVSMAGVHEMAGAQGIQQLDGKYQSLVSDWDEVVEQAAPTAPSGGAGSVTGLLRQELVMDVAKWKLKPEWRQAIDGLSGGVRKGREYIIPGTAEKYSSLIGGPPDAEYQFENAAGDAKNYPPLYRFLPNQELWSLVASTALYIAQPEGLSFLVRGADITNAWLILTGFPDRSPDLVAAMNHVITKLEDAHLQSLRAGNGSDFTSVSRAQV